jgi:type VI secretion system lysozyme-like protein
MSTIVSGSPMPLFDRLAAGGEAHLPGADALRESVARDLGRLLNTRSRLTFEAFAATDGTVIDYGVPDFAERSLRSGGDRDAITAVIQRAIALFEPRLVNVTVTFAPTAEPGPDAVFLIGGDIRIGAAVGHVAFELAPGGRVAADQRWLESA